ncbi:hypothetical protein Tco_0837355 [Tanacetum coccineum]
MNYLSASITARIIEQVKIQLPQILPKEVSNFAPPEIQRIVTESLEHAVLAKESSQPKSTYEATASLTKFELKKILINKMDESQLYLTAGEHRECYDGLIKSYDLDKSLFATYDKVSARGLKKRKTSTDAEPTQGPIIKELKFGSSKGGKSQSKSFGKSAHAEEPEFVVADSDLHKIRRKYGTPQQGPTQSWLLTLASSADKPSKTFDELMSTPIDFYAYISMGLEDHQSDSRNPVRSSIQTSQRLMRSDELYKFSDGTLTRLRISLDDNTKNIQMKYLPQRRWILLEKKELIS